MDDATCIRRSQSCAIDARQAVREFHADVAQPDVALVLFFCSSDYDLEALAEEMNALFPDTQVVGCTTAGEIGPKGYLERSLSGASFSARQFAARYGSLHSLQTFSVADGRDFTRELRYEFDDANPFSGIENSFALLLIDGLSAREEAVTRAIQSVLGRTPLIGGSAGDGMSFGRTHVFVNGRFQEHSAVLVLIATPLPFMPFKTQNFVATDERVIVTDADVDRRVVKELNGRPAAIEYARILGVDAAELGPECFARRPLVVLIDGTSYVRSIQKVNPDDSLTIYSAIENGLILRIAESGDLLTSLEQSFLAVTEKIGLPQIVIGCDCIQRKLAINDSPVRDRIVDQLMRNRTTGFSTYGEQYHGIHLNQTLVGIAIGRHSTEAGNHVAQA